MTRVELGKLKVKKGKRGGNGGCDGCFCPFLILFFFYRPRERGGGGRGGRRPARQSSSRRRRIFFPLSLSLQPPPHHFSLSPPQTSHPKKTDRRPPPLRCRLRPRRVRDLHARRADQGNRQALGRAGEFFFLLLSSSFLPLSSRARPRAAAESFVSVSLFLPLSFFLSLSLFLPFATLLFLFALRWKQLWRPLALESAIARRKRELEISSLLTFRRNVAFQNKKKQKTF